MAGKFVHTEEQILDALRAAGGNRTAAALALGLDRRTMQRRLKKMSTIPDGDPIPGATVYPIMPTGQQLRGVSSLVSARDPVTGKVNMQWIKTERDRAEKDAAVQAALDAMKDELPRLEPLANVSQHCVEELLNLFVLTDYHVGMYSWSEETGDDWDTEIAEKLVADWFKLAVEIAPWARHAVLAQLGDFLHYDSLDSVTPTSRNVLDADTRAQKMVRVGIRVLRRAIDLLLHTHEKVTVVMAEGNHDIMTSAWLRESFDAMYQDEPRVEIITRPDPYYAVQWGETGLFFHHGHLKKPEQIDRVFARKFREIYGAVKYAYGHMGHMHHKLVLESALMTIEQHPTLAAADAHASRHGYMSDRRADVITYDKQFGEVGRITVSPHLLKARRR